MVRNFIHLICAQMSLTNAFIIGIILFIPALFIIRPLLLMLEWVGTIHRKNNRLFLAIVFNTLNFIWQELIERVNFFYLCGKFCLKRLIASYKWWIRGNLRANGDLLISASRQIWFEITDLLYLALWRIVHECWLRINF